MKSTQQPNEAHSLRSGDWERLRNVAASSLGLHVPSVREERLVQAAAALCSEQGESLEHCLKRLESGQVLDRDMEIMAGILSVGETYFFRHRDALADLRDAVLSPLVRRRATEEKRLRLLSAGCATGEEAYTLAMIVDELLSKHSGWIVEVIGVDVNTEALHKARKGEYRKWSFRRNNKGIMHKYFEKTADGRYRVKDFIRKMVSFHKANLVRGGLPLQAVERSGVDAVLCRNVLMYFVPKAAQEAFETLWGVLRPKGYLLVAPSEASLVPDELFEATNTVGLLRRKDRLRNFFPDLQEEVHDLCPAAESDSRFPTVQDSEAFQFDSAVPPPADDYLDGSCAASDDESMVEAEGDDNWFARTVRMAGEHYSAGRYAEVSELLRVQVGNEPGAEHEQWIQAVELLTCSLTNQGDIEGALYILREAVERDKLNALLRFRLANVLFEQGEEQEAVRELGRVIYLEEHFVLAHFLLGNVALRQGRQAEAKRHMRNVRKLLERMDGAEPLVGGEGLTAGGMERMVEDISMKEGS